MTMYFDVHPDILADAAMVFMMDGALVALSGPDLLQFRSIGNAVFAVMGPGVPSFPPPVHFMSDED